MARFYPLGYPLDLAAGDGRVLRAAEESWASFQPFYAEPPITLRVAVAEEGEATPPAPAYRAEMNLMAMVSDARNFAVCDMRGGAGFAALTPGAVRDCAWLRYWFLDAMAFLLLDSVWFTPVHAACVALDDCGVLLCGDSEAGKSSLAYACARRGWTFVSDDASHLERGSRFVAGNCHHLRLRPPARELFPELRGFPTALRANGKTSLEIRTADLPGLRTAPRCAVEHVVFLHRRPGAAAFRPFPKPAALARMLSAVGFSEGCARDAHRRAFETLLEVNVWEFFYSDLDAAADLLEDLARARSSR